MNTNMNCLLQSIEYLQLNKIYNKKIENIHKNLKKNNLFKKI